MPGLDDATEDRLFAAAKVLGAAVRYRSAGTVEFLYEMESREFYFLEVNTRLQVEHGVTEQVTGLDLVEMMIKEAAGELPALGDFRVSRAGASIEARVYAEDPAKGFLPAPGRLTEVVFPGPGLARVETWVERGTEVTPYYDPMIAKIIVTGKDRAEALDKMQHALDICSISGTETNVRYLRGILASATFARGDVTTAFLSDFTVRRRALEVLDGGMQTTIQNYPGRLGYWHVGVPPSGPMDSYALRMANRLVGNSDALPGIEMTGMGARLRFDCDAVIAVCGADMNAPVTDKVIPLWEPFSISAGEVLQFSAVQGAGSRSYLAVPRRDRDSKLSGKRGHLYAGRLWRAWRASTTVGGRDSHRRGEEQLQG